MGRALTTIRTSKTSSDQCLNCSLLTNRSAGVDGSQMILVSIRQSCLSNVRGPVLHIFLIVQCPLYRVGGLLCHPIYRRVMNFFVKFLDTAARATKFFDIYDRHPAVKHPIAIPAPRASWKYSKWQYSKHAFRATQRHQSRGCADSR